MKRPSPHATAAVPSSDPQPFVASLTFTKIVKETVAIHPGEGGYKMGRLLDMHLEEAIMAGQEVQSVTLDIAPETWEQMREAMSKATKMPYDSEPVQ